MNRMKKNIAIGIYPVKYTTGSCGEQARISPDLRFTKLTLFAN